MSPVTSLLTDFERNARAVLEESVARIDARTRSRLNQARQLAVESVGTRQRPRWRTFALMPAGAVAAALVLAVMLWHPEPTTVRESPAAVEDMDLLADADGLDMVEGWDGPFYEWAADQTDANVQDS
jgi:cytochrome c-type biogenesis protein CcmH/NrfG